MFVIELSSRAKKEFNKLKNDKIESVFKVLAIDPVPAKIYDVRKMEGIVDTFRIRIGKIRIVYTIIWKDRIIVISRIDSRESVY